MSFSKILCFGLALAEPVFSQASYWTPAATGPAQNFAPAGSVSHVDFLGNVTSTNTYSSRDCGFHGTVGKFQMNSYGDTSQCTAGSQKDNCWNGADFVGSNSAALDTDNPLQVQDFNLTNGGTRAQQFCPKMNIPQEQNNVFFAIGISNVVDLGNNQGVVYTTVNDRTMGANGASIDNMFGAGVAMVDASGDFPVCTRTTQYWWDSKTEPLWGSNSIVDGMNGYVYLFGSMLGGSFQNQYLVFVARVKKDQAFNLDAYEYWNGKAYTNQRLHNPTPDQAVIQGSPPSQVYWNPYLWRWTSITRDPVGMWGLSIQTAVDIHGPWSKQQHFYDETDLNPQPIAIYSPSAHPQYDPSGQTLVVTYAAYGPISAIKLHFSK